MLARGKTRAATCFLSLVALLLVVLLSDCVKVGGFPPTVAVRSVHQEYSVVPGGIVTVPLQLTSGEESVGCYGISSSPPPGFNPIHVPERVCPGDAERFTSLLSYFISRGTPAGPYQLEVMLTRGDSGTLGTVEVRIVVGRRGGVAVDAPRRGQAWPGGTETFEIRVANRGNYPDVYSISAKARGETRISHKRVELDPGEVKTVVLDLLVPEEVNPQGTCYVTLTASSLSDERVRETRRVEVDLLPPPPEEVGGSLFPLFPGNLKWRNSFRGGSFNSSLDFSWGGTLFPGKEVLFSADIEFKSGSFRPSDGRLEFRDGTSRVQVGSISFQSPSGYLRGPGVRYSLSEGILPFSISIVRGEEPHLYSSTKFATDDFTVDLYMKGLFRGLGASFELHTGKTRLSGRVVENEMGLSLSRGTDTLNGVLNSTARKVRLAYESRNLSAGVSLSFQDETHLETDLEYTASNGSWHYGFFGGLDASGRPWFSPSRLHVGGEFEYVSDPSSWGGEIELENQFVPGLNFPSGGISLEGYWETLLEDDLRLDVEVTLGRLFSRASGVYYDLTFRLGLPLTDDGRWDLDLQAGLRNDSLSVSTLLRGSKAWVEFEAGGTGVGLSLGTSFAAPFPLLPTKGRVVGTAFLDLDCDGKRDVGEPGVSDMLVTLGEGTALTGEDGNFRFRPLSPGEYVLSVLNLSDEYSYSPQTLVVRRGEVLEVAVPLTLTAEITGAVVMYRPEGGMLSLKGGSDDDVEWTYSGTLDRVRVLISDGDRTYKRATKGGQFRVTGLRPGGWTLSIDEETLPPQVHPLDGEIEITLAPGEEVEVDLPVARTFEMMLLEIEEEGT